MMVVGPQDRIRVGGICESRGSVILVERSVMYALNTGAKGGPEVVA
jgi:hypothetical protein